MWYHLNETWEDRKQLLTQCYDLQVYEEYAEQADAWLSNKEGFLANEDLGVSFMSTFFLPYVLLYVLNSGKINNFVNLQHRIHYLVWMT